MSNKSIVRTKIWLIFILGIILALLSLFIYYDTLSNLLLGFGTGFVTSFTVAIILERMHEKRQELLCDGFRKDFFHSISCIIRDLFFSFRYYKFECLNLNTIEYLSFISKNINSENSFVVNHTTLHTLKTELDYQDINIERFRMNAIISEEEEKKVKNFMFRIRALNENKDTYYIDLNALYDIVKNEILPLPEFSDFLFLNFNFKSGESYTKISLSENCPEAKIERIKSSDLFEPLFR
jgi:hypothetical protein